MDGSGKWTQRVVSQPRGGRASRVPAGCTSWDNTERRERRVVAAGGLWGFRRSRANADWVQVSVPHRISVLDLGLFPLFPSPRPPCPKPGQAPPLLSFLGPRRSGVLILVQMIVASGKRQRSKYTIQWFCFKRLPRTFAPFPQKLRLSTRSSCHSGLRFLGGKV